MKLEIKIQQEIRLADLEEEVAGGTTIDLGVKYVKGLGIVPTNAILDSIQTTTQLKMPALEEIKTRT